MRTLARIEAEKLALGDLAGEERALLAPLLNAKG
jgi:hypothetical protein